MAHVLKDHEYGSAKRVGTGEVASESLSMLSRFGRTAGSELFWLLPIAAALVVLYGKVARTGWAEVLFYNGDSLTMPTFLKALGRPEPLHWASSPYLGAFPELPIFWMASLLTMSLQSTIVANGILNFLCVYLLIRWLLRLVSTAPVASRRIVASVTTVLFVLFGFVEIDTRKVALAVYLLFSTYYSGVVLVGLAALCLTIATLRRSVAGLRTGPLLAVLAVVSAAGTFSNPLLAVMAIAPLLGALVISGASVRSKAHITVVATMGLATFLGNAARSLIAQNLIADSASYVNPSRMGDTFTLYGITVNALFRTSLGWIEVVAVVVSVIGSCVIAVSRLKSGASDPGDATAVLVALFGVLASLVGPVALAIAGGDKTSYLTGVVVFPVVAFVVNFSRRPKLRSPVGRGSRGWLPGIVAVAFVALAVPSVGSAQTVVSRGNDGDATCVSEAVPQHGAYGVGGFWSARRVDLYARGDVNVVQVDGGLRIRPWLSNFSSYVGHSFTFVLVEHQRDGLNHDSVVEADVRKLGRPSAFHSCRSIDVYRYEPGSSGYEELNAGIKASAKTWLEFWSGF